MIVFAILFIIITMAVVGVGIYYIVHDIEIRPMPFCRDYIVLNQNEVDETSEIPRQIWTFWNSDDIPMFVTLCIESWRVHCPDYKIHIITPSNLHTVISNHDTILNLKFATTPQRTSDFIRLEVLYEHGGFWMDSSTLLLHSIESLRTNDNKNNSEFVGYYLDSFTKDPRYPVIESWFFGCIQHSPFVGNWRNEFMAMNTYKSIDDYVKHVRYNNIQIDGISSPGYLTMHVAAQVVLQYHQYPTDRIKLGMAEEGPYYYLCQNNWDTFKALDWLFNNNTISTDPAFDKIPFIKFRGPERGVFSKSDGLQQAFVSYIINKIKEDDPKKNK